MTPRRRRQPILGVNRPGDAACDRQKEGGICGQRGAWHIIWYAEKGLSSNCCEDCYDFLAANLSFAQAHRMTDGCHDLMALWYPEEELCRRPRGTQDRRQGRMISDR